MILLECWNAWSALEKLEPSVQFSSNSLTLTVHLFVKVLLGEHPLVKMDNILPSRSGLQTLLEVLDIQLKFWPNLEPSYAKVHSLWKSSYAHGRRKRRFVHSGWLTDQLTKKWIYSCLSIQLIDIVLIIWLIWLFVY